MNELYHYGVKGMKWGVRRTKEQLGYSTHSPRVETKDGNYMYKKGTVIGRFGKQALNNNIMFAYTNKKDRKYYLDKFGHDEQIMVCKKDIKMPSLKNQIKELYKCTGDIECLNDPYNYWKYNINVIGPTADKYFDHMKKQGYDAIIDIRNYGLTDDPIMILNPMESLKYLANGVKDPIDIKRTLSHSIDTSFNRYTIKGKAFLDRYL